MRDDLGKTTSGKVLRMGLVLLLFLLTGSFLRPALAAASAISLTKQQETAPTPEPTSEPVNAPRQGSPFLALLVLLVPFAFLIWKSRGKKAPTVTSSACLPVIDESKQPFKPQDD